MRFRNLAWVVLILGGLSSFAMGADEGLQIGEPPANHVWDFDGLFRNAPEVKEEISKELISLEKEFGMEVFLVLYSALIGEKAQSLADRCQKKWLGNESEGLVVVLSLYDGTAGKVGRSRPLYEGHYLEDGKMPRIANVDLEEAFGKGVEKLKDSNTQVERVRLFTATVVEELEKRLQIFEEGRTGFGYVRFMGWMALGLITCAILIGLLAKLLGQADRRTRKTYHFPDFTVPQRLRAVNGGGKISVIDFGSPSSDA